MIDISTDKPGESLKTLIWEGIRRYPTKILFKLLEDKNGIVRTIAARELQVRGTREIFELTVKLATNDSFLMRELCAFILGQLGTPKRPYKSKSIKYLIELCSDKNASVRSAAVSALGHLRAEDQAPLILILSKDRSPQVRLSVAAALMNLKKSRLSINCLRKLCQDSSKDVRSWAKASLEFLT